jgi:tetratricopeptide (TPR) repeat protein
MEGSPKARIEHMNMKSYTMKKRLACILLACVALAACGKAHKEYQAAPEALELNNKAVSELNIHDLQTALDTVEKAIQKDPGFYNAYANKGAILTEMGREKDAVTALRKAIMLNPNYAEAYVPLGALYEKQGKTPYAKKHYAVASKLYEAEFKKNPDNANSAANYAIALFLNDDRSSALDHLNSFMTSHPKDETLQRVKAKIEARDRKGLVPQRAVK